MSRTTKIIIAVVIIIIVVGSGFYYLQGQKIKVSPQTHENSLSIPTKNAVNVTKKNHSTITILVPKNYDSYKQDMTKFVQTGGKNPLLTMKFVEKKLVIPYTNNLMRASAQAAAGEIPSSGGPAKASVSYFKIKNGTAYILLDIDLNGWAGASVSRGVIHPLVEKTLVQFPEITKVVFGYAPGDK